MTLEEQYEAELDYIRVMRRKEGNRVPVEKRVGNLERHDLPPDGWVVVRYVPFDRGYDRPDCFSCGFVRLSHAYIIKHPKEAVGSIVVGPRCKEKAIG